MANIWDNEAWTIFEHADILHDAENINAELKDGLFNKCLKLLGYDNKINPKIEYENNCKKELPSNIEAKELVYKSEEKRTGNEKPFHEMRNIINLDIINKFFIDSAHSANHPSYTSKVTDTKSHFDYSVVSTIQELDKIFYATTANITDSASKGLKPDNIIDKDNGSEVFYNDSTGNYLGFPNGIRVKTTNIIDEKTCDLYVHYNCNINTPYNFWSGYKIVGDNYIRLNQENTYKDIFNDDNNIKYFNPSDEPVFQISNESKKDFFTKHKNTESDDYKKGIERIVLKALGDRNQSSFLKKFIETKPKSDVIINSTNSCILTNDSHLYYSSLFTKVNTENCVQCIYMKSIKRDSHAEVSFSQNLNKKDTIENYKITIENKLNKKINNPKLNVTSKYQNSRIKININKDKHIYATDVILDDKKIFEKMPRNIEHNGFEDVFLKVNDEEKKIFVYFFEKLIEENNSKIKTTLNNLYKIFIQVISTMDDEDQQIKYIKKLNQLVDALLSLIIEEKLSKFYLNNKDSNIFYLFRKFAKREYINDNNSFNNLSYNVTMNLNIINTFCTEYIKYLETQDSKIQCKNSIGLCCLLDERVNKDNIIVILDRFQTEDSDLLSKFNYNSFKEYIPEPVPTGYGEEPVSSEYVEELIGGTPEIPLIDDEKHENLYEYFTNYYLNHLKYITLCNEKILESLSNHLSKIPELPITIKILKSNNVNKTLSNKPKGILKKSKSTKKFTRKKIFEYSSMLEEQSKPPQSSSSKSPSSQPSKRQKFKILKSNNVKKKFDKLKDILKNLKFTRKFNRKNNREKILEYSSMLEEQSTPPQSPSRKRQKIEGQGKLLTKRKKIKKLKEKLTKKINKLKNIFKNQVNKLKLKSRDKTFKNNNKKSNHNRSIKKKKRKIKKKNKK